MSQEKSLSISRAEIDNFLQILDEFLIRSKLTLYDHYNSKYVVAEDTIILVCEMVAVSAAAIGLVERSVDLFSTEETLEIAAADLMVISQLFMRSTELNDNLFRRNIFYENQ